MRSTILVSGKNGQLGNELEKLSHTYPGYRFVFFDRGTLDITDAAALRAAFNEHRPVFFINTAAYTTVDKAETEQEAAYKINAEAVGVIASECDRHNATLISFSTDYVFNGDGSTPYGINSPIDPVNYYGYTKAQGEQLALANCDRTVIIRTSWVYSPYGNNFVKTMIRLMNERSDINVVNDQFGAPTYAKDLAEATMQIVDQLANEGEKHYGVFHFSNAGMISWFDFAVEIRNIIGSGCNVHPISTAQFPTPAKRPHYSVLDNSRISAVYQVEIKDWKDSLRRCMEELAP